MVSTDDVTCTDDELVLLRPLDAMSSTARHATTRWLWDHGITPSTVALGRGIERDTAQHVLIWRERQADGTVLKRWRFAPHDGGTAWPAPFPLALTTADEAPAVEPAHGRVAHCAQR